MMTPRSRSRRLGAPLERSLGTNKGHGSQRRPTRVDNPLVQRSDGLHTQLTSGLTIREGPADLGLYDTSNTLGDCAVAPKRSAPILAPWSNAVAAAPLLTGTATVAPSEPVIFFSNRILSRQRKKCANMLTSIW